MWVCFFFNCTASILKMPTCDFPFRVFNPMELLCKHEPRGAAQESGIDPWELAFRSIEAICLLRTPGPMLNFLLIGIIQAANRIDFFFMTVIHVERPNVRTGMQRPVRIIWANAFISKRMKLMSEKDTAYFRWHSSWWKQKYSPTPLFCE